MCRLRRNVLGLISLAALASSALAGCGAPGYTYAADKNDQAYFKVPTSWHEVTPQFVAQVQASLLSNSWAGAAGGSIAWSRVYTSAQNPSALALLTSSSQPVVYATVQDLHASLRASLSFDLMRNLLLPVTANARQAATTAGRGLPGFNLIGDSTITTKANLRGINELYEYDIGGQPVAFDQTVLTNPDTTKLYLLLVQCYQACFIAHRTQIATVVNSFTVGGS